MPASTALPVPAEAAASPSTPVHGPDVSSLSVFDTLESTFRSLCRGPGALTLPGALFAPGRRRPTRLREARELLLWPGRIDPEVVDRIWAELVRRAQTGDPAWVVAAAGMLLPALRTVTTQLTAGYPGEYDDVAAEVLTGFLTRLRTIDPDAGRLPSRLRWAGYRAGRALRHRHTEAISRRAPGVEATAPPRPWGHPDFVLAAAVRAHILTRADAELIGSTRLEGIRLDHVVAELGISRRAVIVRRNRAEHRLLAAISEGTLTVPATAVDRRPQPQPQTEPAPTKPGPAQAPPPAQRPGQAPARRRHTSPAGGPADAGRRATSRDARAGETSGGPDITSTSAPGRGRTEKISADRCDRRPPNRG